MIYTCKHCGASFTTQEMNDAFVNEKKFLQCKYCGNATEITDMKGSHVYSGYEHLAESDFSNAETRFIYAIEDSERKGIQPASAAYLGAALARFHVQTVFSDEKKTDFPSIVCHECNENYFADDNFFIDAQMVNNIDDNEREQMRKYEEIIDGIKDHYDKLKQEGSTYDIFIAYDEERTDPDEAIKMYERYSTVSNWFNRKYYKVFCLDMERDMNIAYEAEILYAINHSRSMLVLNDNNINSRLRSIYSRFFNRNYNITGDSPILFARYYGKSPVTLPNGQHSKHVVDIDKKREITVQFARWLNKPVGLEPVTNEDLVDPPPIDPHKPLLDGDIEFPKPVLPQYLDKEKGIVTFGEYPQKRVTDEKVINHFRDMISYDENTCKVLYKNRKGMVVAWYRDDYVDEKKYRCVYYDVMRKAFSLSKNSADGEQRINKFEECGVLYCFEFQPIQWDVEKRNNGVSVLISRYGLDSIEFNNKEYSSDWFDSTLNNWLNNEFMTTAFREEQIDMLIRMNEFDECRVFIPDKEKDINYCLSYKGKKNVTDYYKCVGGAVDVGSGGIRSFWVTDRTDESFSNDEAMVMNPNLGGYGNQYVDCTHVAVVPKVVLVF